MKQTQSQLETHINYAIIEYIYGHSENYRYEYEERTIIAKELNEEQATQVQSYFRAHEKKRHPKETYANGRWWGMRCIDLIEKCTYSVEKYRTQEELCFSYLDKPGDNTDYYKPTIDFILKNSRT